MKGQRAPRLVIGDGHLDLGRPVGGLPHGRRAARLEPRADERARQAPSAHRGDAVKLLRRRLEEMGCGRLVGPDVERTTFEDLARIIADDYRVNGRRSLRRVETALVALRAVFGSARAKDLTLDRLNSYVAARLGAGRAAATARNELASLKRALRLAERAGKAVCPPFPTLSVQNV